VTVADRAVRPPAALRALVDAITAALPDHPANPDGLCAAVWQDPADNALVACADNAEPGIDYCLWHSDRRNGRLLVFRDRGETVRGQFPTTNRARQ
jgi:hypothetical protein